MPRDRQTLSPTLRAPHLAGALFLALITLLISCREQERTPEWNESNPPAETVARDPAPEPEPSPAPQTEPVPDPEPATPPAPGPDAPAETAPVPEQLRFVSYNLKNYLRMSRYENGQRNPAAFKPEKELAPLIKIIVDAGPDVLGVCEVGTPDTLDDLQRRLKEAGLDLPHSRHAGGNDDTRFLGLLSRYPIRPSGPAPKLDYKLQGKPMVMSRGILHARIDLLGHDFHFLGAHLKSKREIPEADQELMRRNEAYLLRKHADTIFAGDPEAIVIVYGDLNDTRRATAVRSVQGAYNSKSYLEAIHHADSRGEVWTHYWDYQHIYSRFDFVLVSKSVRKAIINDRCRVIDDPLWRDASDHRALLTLFDLGKLPARKTTTPAPAPRAVEPEPAPEATPVPAIP
jgi:endonuclease/exonuclease/phosphatase family metal-dependent hydrolase